MTEILRIRVLPVAERVITDGSRAVHLERLHLTVQGGHHAFLVGMLERCSCRRRRHRWYGWLLGKEMSHEVKGKAGQKSARLLHPDKVSCYLKRLLNRLSNIR